MAVEKLIKVKKSHINKKSKSGKFEAPENWRIIFENIKKMRSEKDAIVDEMGAEMAVDKNVDPKVFISIIVYFM